MGSETFFMVVSARLGLQPPCQILRAANHYLKLDGAKNLSLGELCRSQRPDDHTPLCHVFDLPALW
jgi:hypothetical protein